MRCAILLLLTTTAGAQGCGDCTLDGVLTVLDALQAAQLGAGIGIPVSPQDQLCDVNQDGAISVLDALRVAQAAAGLPVTLTCPPVPVSCSLLFPAGGSLGGDIPIVVEVTGSPGGNVDVSFEFSTAGPGGPWSPCATSPRSPPPADANPAPALALNQIHTYLWASLADLGPVSLAVELRATAHAPLPAQCTSSLTVSWGPGVMPLPPGPGDLVLCEVHADPDPTLLGDANGDGVRDAAEDEFLELVNVSGAPLVLDGVTISDLIGVRHTFAPGTTLESGHAIVVFGGGAPTGVFGTSQVVTASTGTLALNNSGDTITLQDGAMTVLDAYTYGGEGDQDQSILASPEPASSPASAGGRPMVPHLTVNPFALYSPGTRLDGFTPRW